jgi:prepilin-type processing-associated H-X9-DG protein
MRISQVTANPSTLVLAGDHGWRQAYAYNSTQRIEWHGRPAWHNVCFLDGHVAFTHIRKGLDVTPEYTVLPFQDLHQEAAGCQVELSDG